MVQQQIARANEDAPEAITKKISCKVRVRKSGYQLEVWFPVDCLYGFDPENNPQLGFFYQLKDSELGDQYLSCGPEFPVANDPSMWGTLLLER